LARRRLDFGPPPPRGTRIVLPGARGGGARRRRAPTELDQSEGGFLKKIRQISTQTLNIKIPTQKLNKSFFFNF